MKFLLCFESPCTHASFTPLNISAGLNAKREVVLRISCKTCDLTWERPLGGMTIAVGPLPLRAFPADAVEYLAKTERVNADAPLNP